jgi:hypothetical protein
MRREIKITVKDNKGVIRQHVSFSINKLIGIVENLPYFQHWFWGKMRRKIAGRVFAELQALKNDAGRGE